MAVLTFPDNIYPTSCDWRLKTVSDMMESPFSAAVQTVELAQYWTCDLTFGVLTRAQGRTMAGLLHSLRGPAGRIRLWDHAFAAPGGTGGGNPVVDGAGQIGRLLNVRGCPVSTPKWLLTGDYFQLGNQLHILTADANTDATGRTTLVFEAAMRTSPTDNAPLILTKPTAVMLLKDDDQTMRRSTKMRVLSSFTLSFREDVTV